MYEHWVREFKCEGLKGDVIAWINSDDNSFTCSVRVEGPGVTVEAAKEYMNQFDRDLKTINGLNINKVYPEDGGC